MASQPAIAIIGAGPSGLVLARLLEQSGITDYVIFERDLSDVPGPGQQGGTLDLHVSSGQLALRRCGLFDEFNRTARWDGSCVHVLSSEAKTVIQHAEPADSPRARPEIDRLHLRQLLLKSVPAEKVRWGHAIRCIERIGTTHDSLDNGCTIQFTNGTSSSGFKLIVGADGAWSKVRPLLSPAKPIYSGKMFIEGKIMQNNPAYALASDLAGPGNMMAIGGGKMLAVQQVADRSYRTNFGLVVPEDFYQGHRSSDTSSLTKWSDAVREKLLSSRDFFETWDPRLKELVENSEGPYRAWPLYYLSPDSVHWERSVAPGVTTIGDAAHLTTPFMGEGVNCSMQDALNLAKQIMMHCGSNMSLRHVAASRLEAALTAYEADMFVRGQDLIRRSAESEATIFSEDACAKFLEFVTDKTKIMPVNTESKQPTTTSVDVLSLAETQP